MRVGGNDRLRHIGVLPMGELGGHQKGTASCPQGAPGRPLNGNYADCVSPDTHAEITRLLMTYSELQDQADFVAVGALFRYGAYFIDGVADVYRGADGVAAMKQKYDRTYADGTLRTKHVTTNVMIENDGDTETARARSYYVVFQQLVGFALQAIIVGRYHDRLLRIDNAWWFRERYVYTDLVGDMSVHVDDAPMFRRSQPPSQ